MTQRQSNLPSEPRVLGTEKLNPQALDRIDRMIRGDEKVVAYSGFDYENKVIAATNKRIIIADNTGTTISVINWNDLVSVAREDRTLVITTRSNSAKYRMKDASTVDEIERMINRVFKENSAPMPPPNVPSGSGDNGTKLESPNIAERVKFWEEQDKINQELIPRVIRQNELLTGHIADHENLPLVAGNAIREALAEAREEQRRQHETEMAELRAEAEEHARQHQVELAAARAEREEQSRQHSNEVTALQAQLRQAKTQLMMIAGGAVVVAIAVAVIGILV